MLDLLVDVGGHHHVLWLEQPPHHVEDSGLPDGRVLRVRRQRSVASHQEVQVGRRDQGRDQT